VRPTDGLDPGLVKCEPLTNNLARATTDLGELRHRNEKLPKGRDRAVRRQRHVRKDAPAMTTPGEAAAPELETRWAPDHPGSSGRVRYTFDVAAADPSLAPEVLYRFARSPSQAARLGVAINPACPAETLVELLRDDDRVVRHAALRHPSVPLQTLSQLCHSKDGHDLEGVAANPACPPELLVRLGTSPSGPKGAVASHPNCPPALLRELAQYDSPPITAPLLLAFFGDPYFHKNSLLTSLASNANCPPDILGQLAASSHAPTRAAVASNPSCPPDILGRLLEDSEGAVVRAAASNRAVPQTPTPTTDGPPPTRGRNSGELVGPGLASSAHTGTNSKKLPSNGH